MYKRQVKSVIKNTKLQVSAEENGWYKVVTDGASGYISKELVTDKPEETSRALEQPRTENPVEQQEVASVNEVNQTGAEVVSTAKQYLGCDYVLGGTLSLIPILIQSKLIKYLMHLRKLEWMY